MIDQAFFALREKLNTSYLQALTLPKVTWPKGRHSIAVQWWDSLWTRAIPHTDTMQTCQRALPADEPGHFSLPWLRGIQRVVMEPSHIQPQLWRINPHCRLLYIESDSADHRTDAQKKLFYFQSSVCHKSDSSSQGHIPPLIFTQFHLAYAEIFWLISHIIYFLTFFRPS